MSRKRSDLNTASIVTTAYPKVTVAVSDEFSVGKWSGRTHYQCIRCTFDSFDRIALLEHLVNAHNSEVALKTMIDLENISPTEEMMKTE